MPLITLKYFTIERDNISFSPNRIYGILAIVFFCMAVGCSLFFVDAAFTKALLVLVITGLMIALPLYFISTKKIVIDSVEKAVYRKSFFGMKKLYDLQDVKLSYVKDINLGSVTGFYRLTPLNDPYGKGIALHSAISATSKLFKKIETVAVPYLERLFQRNQSPVIQATLMNTGHFTYFVEQGSTYISKGFKKGYIALGILFIMGGVLWLRQEVDFEKTNSWCAVFLMVIGIFYISLYFNRIIIDNASHTLISIYFWGLQKKVFSINDIDKFTTVRHYTNGLYDGTDIIMRLNNGEKATLFSRIRSSKKVKILIEEISILVKE